MTYIEDIITDVNKTHPGLGDMVALLHIAVKARKLTLVISPSGCGKSAAMTVIAKNTADAIQPDRLSVAGLAAMAEKLTSYRSVVVVDDIATTQTDYARKTTITTLAALVYTHRIQSVMAGILYEIDDFYGSALIGIQPILLRNLMLLDEWDASIQDKALRYYHLYRPVKPCLALPSPQLEHGLDIDLIDDFEPDVENKDWHKLVALGDCQWSKARCKEHIKDMLKAMAALEQRKQVESEDYTLLAKLLMPMAIENIVVIKEQLEGERYLDNNLLALLAEYFTYNGEFSLAQVALDYKLSLSQCYKIMGQQNGYWQQVSKSPTIYHPSKRLIAMLKIQNLEIKNENKFTA